MTFITLGQHNLRMGLFVGALLLVQPLLAAEGVADDDLPGATDEEDCRDEFPAGMVARIGEEWIPQAQFDVLLAQKLSALLGDRLKARLDVIQVAVQGQLIEKEAMRRGMTSEELLDQEVHSQVPEPKEVEVQKEFLSKPEAYGEDLELVRMKSSHLARRFIESLARVTPHEILIDLGSDKIDFDPLEVVATVGEEKILWRDVSERLEDLDFEYSWKGYTLRIDALNRHLNDRLLEVEASRKKLSLRELLQQDVYSKFNGVSEEDCQEFYQMNRTRIVGEYDQIRDQIEDHLVQRRIQILEASYAEDLRRNAGVEIFIREPQPPVHVIDVEGRASIGPEEAEVTIVEFIDFQCTRCRELSGFVEKVQELYPDRVRLVMCNSPLRSVHANALGAALAAEAARKQGKYWQYLHLLFESQDSLDDEVLESLALELKLDLDRFLLDMRSIECNRIVSEDIEEATRLGIDRTPVIFINGRRIEDKSWEGILTALQREFRRLGERPR